ncbi:MAG: phosphate transport system permease protein PstA [Lysobacterales bacterium]|nr:MAG: phosphate transport system permease protein PstA [Xanthomonadales bacterium]
MSDRRGRSTSLTARGEPFQWLLGGALGLALAMIVGLLMLVLWQGSNAFWPRPLELIELRDGTRLLGIEVRREPMPGGEGMRRLLRVGNFDLYGEDFRWIAEEAIASTRFPADAWMVERMEWGPFIGFLIGLERDGTLAETDGDALAEAHREARRRLREIRRIERSEIGAINHELERLRLALRRSELRHGVDSLAHRAEEARIASESARLEERFAEWLRKAKALRESDSRERVVLADVVGRRISLPLSQVVRFVRPNDLSLAGKLEVYLDRWWEFLSADPREANSEGGVFPAIFGTAVMTILLAVLVAPFGVVTALYLREYARQGRMVSLVRISVNNLAGVPSIVYGVFGLGFFAYLVGGTIDAWFFPERLPSPTFGSGGLLWASLTLALLTVPVVIVATEEALAAVPRSMREGSLACGASKWQTIRNIVLPRAMPGILTGLILAMARGAGEVAPLMLVGVVKLAPELPIDGNFPYLHLDRSFMHLGFHIFDLGFQSRNSEAAKPMVFVTALLLLAFVFAINLVAILVRARMKRRFAGSRF